MILIVYKMAEQIFIAIKWCMIIICLAACIGYWFEKLSKIVFNYRNRYVASSVGKIEGVMKLINTNIKNLFDYFLEEKDEKRRGK